MKYIFAIIAGVFVGGFIQGGGNAYIVGGILGFLFMQLADLKTKINKLENQLKRQLQKSANIHQQNNGSELPDHLEALAKEKVEEKAEQRSSIPSSKPNTAKEVIPSEIDTLHTSIMPEEQTSMSSVVDTNSSSITRQISNSEENPNNIATEVSSNDIHDTSNPELSDVEIKSKPLKPADPIKTGPTVVEVALSKIKSWVVAYFTGGNSLVRTGMLVLFIGVAFLFKYVAERTVVPIEYRYIGISLACLVMLVLGWKLRNKRPGFALSLEGGGIGLLYLTLFAALRLHALLPPSVVLILLISIVLLSAVLAIFQDSMALAVIGMIGGFAAPILTSTGSGSHVQLFSYYLLLNLGVFAIAWFKSWRILNVIGFVATFGIGSIWGYKYYKPDFLLSVEPFLTSYFLMYTFIAVLFALKQPPKLKGINDGTIIFGTPLVGFALQAALMKDSEYGLAYSALALGVFYILFATVIKSMKKPYMRDLIESFVALGVGFATLAIPLGFDGRVTSAMWAAEGCALVWVGIRQSRLLPRFSGYALTLMGMFAFFAEKKSSSNLMPWLNADYIGTLIVVLSTAFIALYARKNCHKLFVVEGQWIPSIMVVFSVVWWVYGGMVEIHSHYSSIQFMLLELFLALSSVALVLIAKKIDFKLVKTLSILVAMTMLTVINPILPHMDTQVNVFFNVRFMGLLILSLTHLYYSWYWSSEQRHKLENIEKNIPSMFLITGLCSWLYAWTTELSVYYPAQEFVLLESMLAITAAMLIFAGIKFKLSIFKIASIIVTLIMIAPFVKIPESNQLSQAMLNIPFFGLLIYTVTHFFMSWYWQRDKSLAVDSKPIQISNLMLGIGLSAWIFTGHNEIYTYLPIENSISIFMVFMSLSFVIWLLFANRLNWKSMHLLSYAFLPYAIVSAYYNLAIGHDFHEGYGLFAWLFLATVNYWVLKIYHNKMQLNGWYHLGSLLLFVYIAVFEFNELIQYTLGTNNIWQQAAASFMLLLISIGLYNIRGIKIWPFKPFKINYFVHGLATLSIVLWLMIVVLNISIPKQSTLFSYMPVLNIIDIIGIVFVFYAWKVLTSNTLKLSKDASKIMMIALPTTAFFILNTSMLRSIHFWYSIDYKFNAMVSSFLVQSAFSILWSLTAVILMVLSAKKHWRTLWLVGLGLMIAVVIKLFLVDMSASGTVERIVAFLSVGVLLSLVGYFSPLPPDLDKQTEKQDAIIQKDEEATPKAENQ